MTARFSCAVESAPEGTQLALSGELDLAAAPLLRNCLRGITESGARHITLDVREVSFVDASGIRAIAAEARRLRKLGGDVTVRGTQPGTRRLFGLLGVSELVTLESADVIDVSDVIDVRQSRAATVKPPPPRAVGS